MRGTTLDLADQNICCLVLSDDVLKCKNKIEVFTGPYCVLWLMDRCSTQIFTEDDI